MSQSSTQPLSDNGAADRVITRFAPSPTGFLHIGGARTALFNWLYARHTGGQYLLRVEDTDRERSNEAAIAAIIDGLAWLGLESDAPPVFQYSRAERHREIVDALLASDNAYKCYASPDELDAMRKAAEAEGRPPIYDGRWRDRDPADAPSGIVPAIRLRSPNVGETVIDDQVQGRVVFQNKHLDDLIILRSDGSPTYNLAVVVDDHDMGVTHVLRGVDHLTNAARQSQIYQALKWAVPVFGHVPLIHGADGAKLSKRHGALGVEAYRAMGYLPAAVRNYLVRLGWSHGDDEIFSTRQMIEWFDLGSLGKSPSRFDFAKLEDLNAHYIRETASSELMTHLRTLLAHIPGGEALTARFEAAGWEKLEASLDGLKPRAKTLLDIIDGAAFITAERPISIEEKASKSLDADARLRLGGLLPVLDSVSDWTGKQLEDAIKGHLEATGLKLGKIGPSLRAAVTGRSASPAIFDVMAVLGRNETLARIRDQAAPDQIEGPTEPANH